MRISDRLLFLRYALPCASTLVKRGAVNQQHIDDLILMVSNNRVPKENVEKMFKVANVMCGNIAKRMGKSSVDTNVIRRYFLLEHSKVVDDRYQLMRDFNPIDCKTYAGKVISIANGGAIVDTSLGKKRYKTVFAKGVKENDKVAVHYDYIIEKISDYTAKKMREAEVRYAKGS